MIDQYMLDSSLSQTYPFTIAGPSHINHSNAVAPFNPGAMNGVSNDAGGRPPRSRKNRPCDSCRRRKTRCYIASSGPPCSLCAEGKRECTFNLAPPARKPRQLARPPSSEFDGIDNHPGVDTDQRASEEQDSPTSVINGKRRRSLEAVDRSGETRRRRRRDTTPMQSSSTVTSRRNSGLIHLADAASAFDHLASSGFEPHGEEIEKSTDRPHVRQISSDPKRPIFVVMQPRQETFRSGSAGMNGLTNLRTLISHQPVAFTEASLIDAYTTHVHPARPILPKGKIAKFPPNLLAAILASSFAHNKNTRSLAGLAANLLQSASEGTGESNLVTVITNIMMIGVRPGATNQGAYLLLAHTIALAQLLGLHLDPSAWSIPAWEQELRIRLWWMLRIHDSWMSFLNSRPSHVQVDNSTAPLPKLASLLESSCAFSPASSDSAKSFIASCRLARLVSRLQSEVCTLGAVANRTQTERREEVEDIYQATEDLLEDWKVSLEVQSSRPRPPGVNSLLLCLLGLRCMLKRIHVELEHGLGAMFDTPSDALNPFTDFVTFITAFTEHDLDGYFLSSSQSQPSTTVLNLVARLVRSLHQYQQIHTWDIAASALRRAATMSDRLQKLQEHSELCEALRGSSSSTPADINLNLSLSAPVVPITTGDVTVEPQLVWDWSGAEIDLDQILLGLSSATTIAT
ncbi:uncharacterized protein I206_104453 [Kwoniella pini CBS 10737]|uniref:Zn(2)-C6 fungal-type domain-containing protein n=1 Tax=Kwoniella pini CBS 10737 TaxID=1296096 RepID=A0AAJ8L7G4_9TREE